MESFIRLSKMTAEQQQKYLKYYNEVLLTGAASFKLEKPNKVPNNYGLYFDIEYLQNIDKSVVMLPLELMAEYRDVLTEQKILNDKFTQGINVEELEEFSLEKDYNNINATTIGNLAYTILNSSNKELVEYSTNILNQIFVKYKGEVLTFLNETI